MKIRIIFSFFLMVFVVSNGNANEKAPVAISPGSESGIALVRQSCPTFSWSAVQWADGYRVMVFKAVSGDVLEYEEMDEAGYAVINKEIQGPALSWTPSENERLINGEFYVWYVQAVDALGVGTWSEGRMFIVEEVEEIVAIGEKVRERLKEYGVKEEVITEVLKDFKAGGNAPKSSFKTSDQGTEGNTSTFYGKNAGRVSKGLYNSFFGSRAGFYNTSGKKNTFIGYAAGYKNKTGEENAFLGSFAGTNSLGSYNTFLGPYAGYKNTTGANNTFVGKSSGYSNTKGKYNTFLGYKAGYKNTTGLKNTFLGYLAGYKNTTGLENIFIGKGAGYSNTTAHGNTFLGYDAGYSNTTHSGNTFIGTGAGYKNIRRWNTFIGASAGHFNTTGEKNTFLGYEAGYNNKTGVVNQCCPNVEN